MYENFWYLTNIGGGALLASFISYSLFKNKRMLYYSDMKYHLKKSGFTLAEVLITLGIIGVVAALIMATIIANYQKSETITLLKRSYSQIANAVVASEAENGDHSEWDLTLSPQDFFTKYLKKYLPVVKECLPNSGVKCSNIENRVDLKNTTAPLDGINRGRFYGVVLNNGNILWIQKFNNQGFVYIIMVDINGDKGPNRNGRDLFGFAFTKDGFHGYSHYGFKQNSRYDMAGAWGGCNLNACCSFMGAGGGCSQMIMYDNWQIKSDYPW